VACAHQHATIARGKREYVAGRHYILRSLAGIDRYRNGARAISRRDSCGYAFFRLDRDRESGLHAFLVVAAHRFKPELLHALASERQADQPAPMRRHEVYRIGRGHLCRDDQITFVLAILIIDQDIHAAIARLVNDFLD